MVAARQMRDGIIIYPKVVLAARSQKYITERASQMYTMQLGRNLRTQTT